MGTSCYDLCIVTVSASVSDVIRFVGNPFVHQYILLNITVSTFVLLPSCSCNQGGVGAWNNKQTLRGQGVP